MVVVAQPAQTCSLTTQGKHTISYVSVFQQARMNEKRRVSGESEEQLGTKKVKLSNDSGSDDEFADLEDTVQVSKVSNTKYTDKATYLESINRNALNFDLPMVCSASVATTNIHICLVCNKYLQGASSKSPAYMHAIDTGHHVYINAVTSKFIILPEQLVLSERLENDLSDIKLLLNPVLDHNIIRSLDTSPLTGNTLLNKGTYKAGFVPLVNDSFGSNQDFSKITDNQSHMHNTIYYALSHLSSIRDTLLEHENSESTPLINHLSLLTKKIWSPYLFKKLTSSYALEDFLIEQKIPDTIAKDSRLFYNWVVNILMKENKSFKKDLSGKLMSGDGNVKKSNKFSLIPIKLPQQSVFKDSLSTSIEQYQLESLLEEKKLKIVQFPKYLVLYIDRTNDLSVKGLEQKLNMNIVKYDPESLLVDGTKYSLAANVTYDLKTQVHDKARDRWVEYDGKNVREVEKELLFISNCKILFWERQ